MSNSGTVTFIGGLTVYINAFSNAARIQTVTITPPQGTAAVFSGSGEGNVPLSLTTQGFLSTSQKGSPYFVVPGSPSQNTSYTVTCTNNGPGQSTVEVNSSTYSTPAQGVMYLSTVVSEDSTDQDFNDSATYFTAWQKPS